MKTKLIVEIGLERAPSRKSAQPEVHAMQPTIHVYTASTTRLMASDMRSQLAVSVSSWRRPALVNE